MEIFYITLFGGLGCLSRYAVSGWTLALVGRGNPFIPYGTLVVNVGGSFLLGLIAEIAILHPPLIPADIRMGITTGFMGGFTTFSTFSNETFRLFENGSYLAAGANILLNVAICLVFAALGIYLARTV